ncbi:MAG: hypothetical protein FD159_1288 [Syntrophaceae bacterium]|nr:MAG: hypothetical protein FD159_1288 [Syntrophaceae bacterium]
MKLKQSLRNIFHPGQPSRRKGAPLGRVMWLSVLLLFASTSAMAASDSEIARKYMEEYPAVHKTVAKESDSEIARKYMAEHPLPVVEKPVIAAPDGDVARVKTFTGTASIVRANKVIPVNKDAKLYQGDALRTGKDGSLGIIFRDNTLLSLGPNSAVIIEEFLFSPAQGKLSIVTRMLKGTAAYLSGVIAKLSPKSVRFLTPVGNVGFRGTKFLVRIDGEEPSGTKPLLRGDAEEKP